MIGATQLCQMDVGCETVGVCFASANGRPDLCGRPENPVGYPFIGAVARGLGPDMLAWEDCVDRHTRWAFDGVQIWRQKDGQRQQWHRTDRVPFHPSRGVQMGDMIVHHLGGARSMTSRSMASPPKGRKF